MVSPGAAWPIATWSVAASSGTRSPRGTTGIGGPGADESRQSCENAESEACAHPLRMPASPAALAHQHPLEAQGRAEPPAVGPFAGPQNTWPARMYESAPGFAYGYRNRTTWLSTPFWSRHRVDNLVAQSERFARARPQGADPGF